MSKLNTEELLDVIDNLDYTGSFLTAEQVSEGIEQIRVLIKSPEVTEAFIEKKGTDLFGWSVEPKTVEECKDFIRSLFKEEVQAKIDE